MNNEATPNFTDALGQQFTRDTNYHLNLTQDVVIITEDRLELCLRRHSEKLAIRERWIAPASLLITFAVVLVTSDFRDVVFPPATWQAVFVILTFLSLIWTVRAAWKAWGSKVTLAGLVAEIKAKDARQK